MGHTMEHLEQGLAQVHVCEPFYTPKVGVGCLLTCVHLLSTCMLHEGGKERYSGGCPHRGKASREGFFMG